jgi:outer membrane receptor protein involved in Fe transport
MITANAHTVLYVARRNVEGGGRQQDFHNSTFRIVSGLKGEITSSWHYDASLQFSRLSATQRTLNYFVTDRIQKALDVVNVAGVPTCQSVVDKTDLACVPYNIFKIGGVTPAALNYLQATGMQIGIIDQKVAAFNVTGDLFTLPTAASPTAISFGYEGRRDSLGNTVDALQVANQLSGAGGGTPPLAGATKADDLYLEFRAPLLDKVPGARDLSVDAAFRRSDYGHSLKTNTWKVGVEWAPISDIRLRASYQRAVRAPNIVELFTSQGLNLFDMVSDPCSGATPVATLAQCVATGMPAGRYGLVTNSPAGQYNFLQGGNPSLQPEKGDTKSFGIVLQPSFVPGLSLTIDYFDIKVDQLISTFGTLNTIKACYTNNSAAACGLIHRDPTSGTLWRGTGFVSDTNTNIGGLKTSGIDFVLNYDNIHMGAAGRLGIDVTSTNLRSLVTDPGGGFTPYDCKGLFGNSCGGPNPTWRHHARVTWHTPVQGLDTGVTVRYISAVDMYANPVNRIDQHFGAKTYLDFSFGWAVTEKASLHGGISNVLDADPPLNVSVGTGVGNGNTYPGTYDALGRHLFLGLTYKF